MAEHIELVIQIEGIISYKGQNESRHTLVVKFGMFAVYYSIWQ